MGSLNLAMQFLSLQHFPVVKMDRISDADNGWWGSCFSILFLLISLIKPPFPDNLDIVTTSTAIAKRKTPKNHMENQRIGWQIGMCQKILLLGPMFNNIVTIDGEESLTFQWRLLAYSTNSMVDFLGLPSKSEYTTTGPISKYTKICDSVSFVQ